MPLSGPRIVRVFGTINIEGVTEIIFSPVNDEQTKWESTITDRLDQGEYIITLYLEDWAGNIGFYATIWVEVLKNGIISQIVVLDYNNEVVTDVLGLRSKIVTQRINK